MCLSAVCTRYSVHSIKFASVHVLFLTQAAPLLNAVATVGPIAISVDASAWSAYESGVFDGCSSTNIDIDHAVQLVGE